MIHLTLIIWAFLILICEAKIESEHGDKRHWTSLFVTFVLYCIPLAAIQTELKLIFIYPMMRVWFDFLYNFCKGNRWGYIGETAWTDRMINKMNLTPNEMLLIRFMLSLTFLILSI